MANESYSEKVSVNINTATLSNIDLLVDNGYYSNRSDFINQALRDSLQKHQNTLDRIIDKEMETSVSHAAPWFIGIYSMDAQDLEAVRKQGRKINVTGYGVMIIGESVPDDLVFETVERIHVKGRIVCSRAIKNHYGLR